MLNGFWKWRADLLNCCDYWISISKKDKPEQADAGKIIAKEEPISRSSQCVEATVCRSADDPPCIHQGVVRKSTSLALAFLLLWPWREREQPQLQRFEGLMAFTIGCILGIIIARRILCGGGVHRNWNHFRLCDLRKEKCCNSSWGRFKLKSLQKWLHFVWNRSERKKCAKSIGWHAESGKRLKINRWAHSQRGRSKTPPLNRFPRFKADKECSVTTLASF